MALEYIKRFIEYKLLKIFPKLFYILILFRINKKGVQNMNVHSTVRKLFCDKALWLMPFLSKSFRNGSFGSGTHFLVYGYYQSNVKRI